MPIDHNLLFLPLNPSYLSGYSRCSALERFHSDDRSNNLTARIRPAIQFLGNRDVLPDWTAASLGTKFCTYDFPSRPRLRLNRKECKGQIAD